MVAIPIAVSAASERGFAIGGLDGPEAITQQISFKDPCNCRLVLNDKNKIVIYFGASPPASVLRRGQ